MKKIKIFLPVILVILLSVPSFVWSAPQINSASSLITHGQIITISGNNFGIKSTVTPLHWDNAEGKSGAVSATSPNQPGIDQYWSVQGGGGGDPYRPTYRNSGYRDLATYGSRSSAYIVGGHGGACEPDCDNMGLTVRNIGGTASDTWYVSFYSRIDWPLNGGSCGTIPYFFGSNYKYLSFQSCPNGIMDDTCGGGNGGFTASDGIGSNVAHSTGTFNDGNYITHSGTDYSGSVSVTGMVFEINRYSTRDQDAYSCSKEPFDYSWTASCKGEYPSDRDDWIRHEVLISKSVGIFGTRYWTGTDNDWGLLATGLPGWTFGGGDWNIPYFSVGAYTSSGSTQPQLRYCRDAWKFFDDIYIDVSLARVMLCNNANYESSTICEPQIPSAWNSNSINVSVNLGTLPDSGTAYLYVCDSNNDCNAIGYPVTLGSSGGDTTPPAAPSGLNVQ